MRRNLGAVSKYMEQFEEIIEMEAGHILNVFGEYDKYVKKLEKYLSVTIVDRDGGVRITGSRKHVEQTAAILNQLLELSKRGNPVSYTHLDVYKRQIWYGSPAALAPWAMKRRPLSCVFVL